MDKSSRKNYCYALFKNFDKILSELELVYILNQNAEKGREAEEILKSFLKEYLPKRFSVTTGFIQSDSGMSSQCDIIIYDPNNIAPIFSGYINKLINIITLRAVIECKMVLDETKFSDTNKRLANIKNLYRQDGYIQEHLKSEPLTILFAYKSSKKEINDFVDMINKLEDKNIDLIFCADKGMFFLNNGVYANVNPIEFYGITTDGYNASREKHGFAIFYSYLMDKLESIECNYKNYNRILNYTNSAIHLDYINK